MKEPLHIALLLQDLEYGGTQRYAVNLLRHIDRDLFAPELWLLRGGDGMVPMAQETGVRITRFSESMWVGPHAIFGLGMHLLRKRPQILYTLTVVPNIWGRLLGKMARVPVIVAGFRNLAPKQCEKWLWRVSDRVICNAAVSKEKLVGYYGVPEARVAYVPNAVDTDFFSPDPDAREKNPTVVYIGRLVREKDPLGLVAAFRLTAEKVPAVRFEMIGDGYLRKDVEALIRECGLESRVRLIPGTNDVRTHLRRAWVFVLGSKSESSANVVLEAMAMGLPIVATRVGGLPDLVVEGETGLLVEPVHPRQLADSLARLIREAPRRLSMGIKARERAVALHSIRATTRRTEEVLLGAVADARKAGRLGTGV
ncbi:MAG: glycosyltransferase [Thermodesulfobacteriota bacterium]